MPFGAKSSIVFGAGAFNAQYNEFEPELQNVSAVLKHAFDKGITTIDTSAFYGASEEILGKALGELNRAGVQRKSYELCTKCCRWETNEFDFSRETVLKSVARSLQRLNTDYVDVLYIHDVEFGTPDAVMKAIAAAFELKAEGKVLRVGISGYPLDILAATAQLVKRLQPEKPLDAILSYCNLTLQNDLLLKYKPLFEEAGVQVVLNASPLSMSLLRSGPTHRFHPADEPLREKADEIGANLQKRGIEFADVATQYSIANWPGPTVIGLRTIAEIDSAIANREKGLESPQTNLWDEIIKDFGKWHNFTWEEEKARTTRPSWKELVKSLPA